MGSQEFLAQRIRDLEASVAYFAPETARTRERQTVTSFVENLQINFTQDEIISPDDDPPDVVFRDARFEIKEILDPGRRRHDEYKAELKRARTLTDPKDLLEFFTPKDEHIGDIFQRCESVAADLQNKYPAAVRSELDLLFYVNLMRVMSVTERPFPVTDGLSALGWRSISFVMGQRSCCFFARSDAPEFIRLVQGRIGHLHPR